MSNEVYANNMEISCKAASGKSICSFPDVCFTPPQTPATPPGVPIPYPNTGMAADTSDGSSTVQISSQEVMLKNKSCFKKSTGDEAGCAPKKGLINSTNTGKVYFKAWSMDVKIEGENVVRHFDMTTHNHASDIGNDSIPWMHIDSMANPPPLTDACKKEKAEFDAKCKKAVEDNTRADGTLNLAGTGRDMCKKPCKEIRACVVTPYAVPCCKRGKKKETPHHIVPNSLLQGTRGANNTNVDGLKGYTMESGPCVCLMGKSQTEAEHGDVHELQKKALRTELLEGRRVNYTKARDSGTAAHNEVMKDDKGKPLCNPECLKAQIDIYFKEHSQTTTSQIDCQQQDGATSWDPDGKDTIDD